MVYKSHSLLHTRLNGLMTEISAGDRDSLKQLYQNTNAKLFGVTLRICKNEDVAKELLQECYIKIWQNADKYNAGQASVMSWLISIARNNAIDWKRKQPVAEIIDSDILIDMEDKSIDIEKDIEAEDNAATLRFCLEKIDGKYAPAIRNTYLDGLTYAELAQNMGKPLGTIKSWIRRGLSQLKACINRRRRGVTI